MGNDKQANAEESKLVEMAQFAEEASPIERAMVQAYISGLRASVILGGGQEDKKESA